MESLQQQHMGCHIGELEGYIPYTDCYLNFCVSRSFKLTSLHSAFCVNCRISKTRMWANAQADGRPAEHRWRSLFNAAKFG